MSLKKTAKHLQSMGTGGDTILAHINPEEAAMLKAGGGSGKRNPKTGLLSFSFGDGNYADPNDGNSGGGVVGGGGGGGYGGPDYYGGLSNINAAAVHDAGLGAALAEALGKPGNPGSGMGLTPDINYIAPTPNPVLQFAGKYGGVLGPLLGGALGMGAYFDRSRANQNIGSGYGGSEWGGTPSGAQAESGYGGDNRMEGGPSGGMAGGLLGAPAAQVAALPPTYPRPAFISKWGKPRGAFTNPYATRRGLLGG